MMLTIFIAVCLSSRTCRLALAEDSRPGAKAPDAEKIATAVEEYDRVVLPILEQYCFGCHADGGEEGGFSLDQYPSSREMVTDTPSWWSVLKNVRADVMPPEGEEQPSDVEKRLLFDWITGRAFASRRDPADPGKSPLRRLNRAEYRNTIRDLMGIEFDTSVEFPPDDSGDGFDNNADALSISPLLAEKYIDAAREIVDQAVPQTSRVIPVQSIDEDDFQIDPRTKSKSLSFDKASTATATFKVTANADYRVVVPIEVVGSFNFNSARARVRLLLGDELLHDQQYGWKTNFVYEVSLERQLTVGDHSLQLIVDPIEPTAGKDKEDEEGTFVKLRLPTARIEGPLDPSRWNKPDGYDRFFHRDTPPTDPAEQVRYASEVLRRFCLRAYRRPVDEDQLSRLLDVAGFSAARDTAADELTFEQRIGRAITVVLASPRFLFRVDQPQAESTETFPEIDDYSLASRLSYFLWSTTPDDELLELSEQGVLRANLIPQVERMLMDDRSDRMIENFVGQWLQTRDVESVSIDPLAALGLREEYEQLKDYLESTDSGRGTPPDDAPPEHQAAYKRYREIREHRDRLGGEERRNMVEETLELFSYVLQENRSLVELVDSDYAFLNQRLADHYGVPGVKGDQIRKVELPPDSPLGGVLTQGTFLLVTSNPTRTSPVKRGLFILDNILGTPAPPAPAMVPELEESAQRSEIEKPTLRQLLELHRSEALCRSCHARFDPLGLAFENFTAIATWRDQDNGQPIQPGGQLISGESFDNVTQLKQVLAGPRRADFYRCLSERMLSYAIGRSLDFGDEVALEQITRDLQDHQGQAKRLIMGVVHSAPFGRMRRHGTGIRHRAVD